MKHILVGGVSLYWNSKSKNLLPHSTIWDDEKNKKRIFQKLHPEQLRLKLLEPFAGNANENHAFRTANPGQVISPNYKYQYLINPFTIDINISYYDVSDEVLLKSDHHRLRLVVLISSIQLDVFPELINDLCNMMSYFEGQAIAPLLKKYRPQVRPYTQEVGSKDP